MAYILIFLVCILACTAVSLILRRFCSTVSPVNQNIIRKLSSFSVFLITPAVYVQVVTKKNSFHKSLVTYSQHHGFLGNFCDLQNSLWTPGVPDCPGVSSRTLLSYHRVLWNRKHNWSAQTAYCSTGLVYLLQCVNILSNDPLRMRPLLMRIRRSCLKTLYSWCS